jgi:predicted nuclease with TOPRIM domain
MNRDEATAKLTEIRAKLTALFREEKSLPLKLENLERLEIIRIERAALEAEFKAVSGKIASI